MTTLKLFNAITKLSNKIWTLLGITVIDRICEGVLLMIKFGDSNEYLWNTVTVRSISNIFAGLSPVDSRLRGNDMI